MSQVYTIDEVSNHKSEKSVWIIIHNDVYDVTAFLNEHPGGADSLLDVAGMDGTQPFEDVNHSEDARIMMKKYKIGTLPPGERRKFMASCCPPLTKSECDSKTWRTYDGSSGSKSISTSPKNLHKSSPSPKPERRVPSIIVPKERRPRVPPCSPERPDCRLKWALVALAGALIIGFVLKKYTS